MKNFSFLFTFLLCVFALFSLTACDFKPDSGLWSGNVEVQNEGLRSHDCNLEVDITHTDDHITLHHVSNRCYYYSSKWHGGTFEVRGTGVWKRDRLVGWAQADGTVTLQLDESVIDDRFPFPAQRMVVSWNRVGGQLRYSEDAYTDLRRVHSASGWLSKSR